RLLGPLFNHLHAVGTARDRAGNRQLFYDQYATLRDYSVLTGFWYGSRGACVVECWPQYASKEDTAMFGPGAYRPDPSEGITATADLPQPEIVPYSRNDKRNVCPRCGHVAYRDKQAHRTLHDLGNLDLWCPRDLVITYSQHYCTKCRKYFNADL